jgi:hypothetical protein
MKIRQSCKCKNTTFTTVRGVQVDVELDENGNWIRNIAFGDYYDDIGENIVRCLKCNKKAEVID